MIVQVGGPDAALAGLDPAAGRWLWTTAGDTVDFQTPVPGAVGGREQVFVAGLTQVMGVDPTTGELLWQHDHGGQGFTGPMSLVPVPAGPDRLFFNHDDHTSTVIELNADAGTVRPLIAVFIEPLAGAQYADIWTNEIIPFIDATYRTIDSREGRASVGGGRAGYTALSLAFQRTDLVEKVGAMTPVNIVFAGPAAALRGLVAAAEGPSMDLYMEWGLYDARAPHENWDLRDAAESFMDFLVGRGYTVAGGAVPDGTGWSSWKNRTDLVLRSLFPLDDGRQ